MLINIKERATIKLMLLGGGGGTGGICLLPIHFHNATFNSKCISHRKFSNVVLELPHDIKSM